MMAGAGETRKAAERKPALMDVGVPFVKRAKVRAFDEDEGGAGEREEQGGARGMRFTLLTKKGSKQQVSLRSSLAQR
jgi:hypothetical protein